MTTMKLPRMKYAYVYVLVVLVSVVNQNSRTKEFMPTKDFLKEAAANTLTSAEKKNPTLLDASFGSSGRWVLDYDYANRSNYPNHGSYSTWHLAAQNFTPTPDQPYRLAASYRWEDDNFQNKLREVSLIEFCTACHKLGITRILSLGDSLTAEFVQSLVSLLGFPPQGNAAKRFNARLRPINIPCRPFNAKSFQLEVMWMRRSSVQEILSLSKTSALEEKFVAENRNRTAIIANFGAWFKSLDDYKQAFDSFLTWVDKRNGSNNSTENKLEVFFRETIPGHWPCFPEGERTDETTYNWIKPVDVTSFKNYTSYQKSLFYNQTSEYNWEMFEDFNKHARTCLRNRSETLSLSTMGSGSGQKQMIKMSPTAPVTPIHWLNVFNSTVLRRDGHIGYKDCLHYYLPGPTDWWAHFFHSFILDMSGV